VRGLLVLERAMEEIYCGMETELETLLATGFSTLVETIPAAPETTRIDKVCCIV
jgi:hypothetical protein